MTLWLASTRTEIANYLDTLILVYLVLIFIRIIMSWIPRIPYNRYLDMALNFVRDVTDPYLNLFRRIIPPVRMGPGALDLSPIIATFVLLIVGNIVVQLIHGQMAGPGPAQLRGWARAGAMLGVVVALDQATKQAAAARIDRGEQVNVFLGLDLTNSRNTGVAFGAFQDGGTVIGVLIGAALALLLGYFALNAARSWLWLPVGLLLGGALGNLADRARTGAVIDFIDPIAWPAFNLADAAIVVGVLGLLYVIEGPPGRPESP